MPSSSGGQTSTSKSEPWEGQKPYVREGYAEAQNLYNKGPAQYFPGQTVAGFGNESNSAMNAIFSQGMGGQAQRAGSQHALDQFSGGGMGDWGTVGQMRGLGANNNFASNPMTSNLAGMAANNNYASNPATANVSAMAANNNYAADPAYGTLAGVMGAGGANMAKNLYGRTSDIIESGGNVAGRLDGRIGDLIGSGGNIAGYSQGAIGDITQTGGGSNSQIRNDTYDLITGQAQANNPAFGALSAAANGNFIGANPYLDDTYARAARGVTRQFAEGVTPGLDSAASAAGRYGSGMHANVKDAAGEGFGRTLGDLATSIYGGNYAQERQNQLSAASTLGSQYLQGQGLRASTAGQSADQATRDAALRLQAAGQISGDMSGDASRRLQAAGMSADAASQDLARRMQASDAMTRAEQGDYSNLMSGLDMQSRMFNTGADRQMQANQQLSSMFDQGANRQLQANQQIGSAYESGADRQMNALNSASNAYLQNRAQQLQGLGMQGQYQDMAYKDLNAASAVGQQRDAKAQQMIDADVARHDFGQNAEWQSLARYMNLINGGSPGQSVTTTGAGGNPWASLFAGLGGAGQFAAGTRGLLW